MTIKQLFEEIAGEDGAIQPDYEVVADSSMAGDMLLLIQRVRWDHEEKRLVLECD